MPTSESGFMKVSALALVLIAVTLGTTLVLKSQLLQQPQSNIQVLGESSKSGSGETETSHVDNPVTTTTNIKTSDDSGKNSVTSSVSKIEIKQPEINNEVENEFEDRKIEDSASKSAEVEDETENELQIDENEGEPIVDDGTHSASSHFPLSIDPLTHALIVTTPAGTKVVAILPSQAVANLLANNPKIEISESTDKSASGSALPGISLEDHNGSLVYKIEGREHKNLFGLFPINIPVSSFVSAQSGELTGKDQGLLEKLLNLLSV